jgi:hypothetical protein
MNNPSKDGTTGWDVLDAFRVQNRKLPQIADAIDQAAISLVRYATIDSARGADTFFELVDGDIRSSFGSPRLRMLFRYWRGLAEDGSPNIATLRLEEIEALLPNVMIVDLSPPPLRIFYRHVGSEVAKFTGLEFTGHYLDEFLMEAFNLNAVQEAYRVVRESGKPGAGVESYVSDGVCKLRTEYLICPLWGTAEVEHCIVAEDYFLANGIDASELVPAKWA